MTIMTMAGSVHESLALYTRALCVGRECGGLASFRTAMMVGKVLRLIGRYSRKS